MLLVSPEGFSSISPVNNVTLNRGDDTTLQCTTTAGPGIQYRWFQRATERVCCSNGDVNITGIFRYFLPKIHSCLKFLPNITFENACASLYYFFA